MTVASLKSCQVPCCWAALPRPELSEEKWSGSFVWNVELQLWQFQSATPRMMCPTAGPRGGGSTLPGDANPHSWHWHWRWHWLWHWHWHWPWHCSDMKLSQFDLISTPTGNETTLRSKGETILLTFFGNPSENNSRLFFHTCCQLPSTASHGRLCNPGQ